MNKQTGGYSMNSINKEKALLKSVANQIKEENCTEKKEMVCESYYRLSSQRTELRAYHFETIVQLRQILTEMWSTDEKMQTFIPVVLAAVFKNRPESNDSSIPLIEHKDGNNGEILPVYTYTL